MRMSILESKTNCQVNFEMKSWFYFTHQFKGVCILFNQVAQKFFSQQYHWYNYILTESFALNTINYMS